VRQLQYFDFLPMVCVFTGMRKPMITTTQTLSTGFTQKKERDCSVLDRISWVSNIKQWIKHCCNEEKPVESNSKC
jgi:hypothetical protein